MRQDLEQEYERLKTRSFNIDSKNGKRHQYASDVSLFSLNDIHQMQQKLVDAQAKQEEATFEAEHAKAKVEELALVPQHPHA